ncbi:MAG: alpha/beta fold hydrolase [Acidimicrobiales bacterium]
MRLRSAVLAAGAAAAAGAVLVGPRLIVRRLLAAEDLFADDPVAIPPDVIHHSLTMADGGELHVVERGPRDARPLVLLHGITLAAEVWGYQLRDLAPAFRVVAPDLRGHGGSTAGSAGYGIGPIAGDIAALLEQLDLRDAVIVGHSMGGMVLQRALAEHLAVLEARAAGLVFLSTTPGPPLGDTGRAAIERFAGRAAGFGSSRGWRAIRGLPPGAAGTMATALGFGRAPSASHVLATERWLRAMQPESSWQTGLTLGSHSGLAGLRSWSGPALVLVGTRDLLTPVRFARRIAGALRDVHLEVIEGCGHMMMLERRDELDALLRDFVARLPMRVPAP